MLGRDTERSDVVSSASQLATCCLAYSGMTAGVEERVKEDGGREGGKEGRREEGEKDGGREGGESGRRRERERKGMSRKRGEEERGHISLADGIGRYIDIMNSR